MQSLFAHFGHPRGLVGHLVGWAMAFKNRERTEWAVSLLNVQPADRVLDIGCGPGVAVQRIASAAPEGFVAGVDISEVMVTQATRRNIAAIHAGRVEVKQGAVERIPYSDQHFDKALAVNSYRFWPAPVENLKELRRTLKPGGLLAIIEQPMSKAGEASVPALRDELHSRLTGAGFRNIRLVTTPMKPATCVGALGTKDG
ncbi:MAG: class I SAM-dependent methyltransferase [Anaerolineales bacterium]